MIELGSMSLRDQESVSAAREKVLGLVRALKATDVAATRAATAVSEAARRCLTASGNGDIGVALTDLGRDVRLHLRFGTEKDAIDATALRPFFDRVNAPAPGSGAPLVAELTIASAPGILTPNFIARERDRIAAKSRTELLDELRLKNRQLEEYNASLEATVAERTAELRLVNDHMRRDLDAGAAYVRAIIPAPIRGQVDVDWRYVPSTSLGGDTIGYHWLDRDHLVFYLIDVTGHGLDSALLAVTATNMIRAGTLSSVDMRRPEQVIAALNEAFQSDRHGGKYFTIWYGVFEPHIRRLTWSGAGHHPSLLLIPGAPEPVLLPSSGPLVGCAPGLEFPAETCAVPPSSRLLVFSDGVFEILRDGRVVWNLRSAIEYFRDQAAGGGSVMDALLTHVHELRANTHLDDDFSIIEAFLQ